MNPSVSYQINKKGVEPFRKYFLHKDFFKKKNKKTNIPFSTEMDIALIEYGLPLPEQSECLTLGLLNDPIDNQKEPCVSKSQASSSE